MVKKRSITRFVFMTIVAIIGILLTVCSFTIPYTTTNYNGFINSIPLGLDYSNGISIVYSAEKSSQSNYTTLDQSIEGSFSDISKFLSFHGYSEYEIAKQGDDKLSIKVLESQYSSSILALLENPQKIYFTVEEASDEKTPNYYLSSKDISYAEVAYDQTSGVYGINITLTNLGKISLKNLKTAADNVVSDTVYIYLDEVSSSNSFGTIAVSKLKDTNMFISSSSASNTTEAYSTAYQTASNIFVGTFDIELSQISMDTVSPKLGSNAWTLTLIAFLIFLIAIFVFLWTRYGDLGLIASFAMIFFVVLQMFFMQSIPFVRVDLAGAIAMFLSVVLFLLSMIVILEKIGKEYANGNRIHVSCKNGFKKSFWRLFDLHVISLVTSTLMLIIGIRQLSYFGGVMFIASIVSMFSLYVLFRFFVNSYLPLNSTKPKKLKLYREANVKEIKEEDVEIIPEDKAKNFIEGGQAND